MKRKYDYEYDYDDDDDDDYDEYDYYAQSTDEDVRELRFKQKLATELYTQIVKKYKSHKDLDEVSKEHLVPQKTYVFKLRTRNNKIPEAELMRIGQYTFNIDDPYDNYDYNTDEGEELPDYRTDYRGFENVATFPELKVLFTGPSDDVGLGDVDTVYELEAPFRFFKNEIIPTLNKKRTTPERYINDDVVNHIASFTTSVKPSLTKEAKKKGGTRRRRTRRNKKRRSRTRRG